MNLFHRFWPDLLKEPDFVRNFATPLIKVRRRNDELAFFSMDGTADIMALHSRGGQPTLSKLGDTKMHVTFASQSTIAGARARPTRHPGQSSTAGAPWYESRDGFFR